MARPGAGSEEAGLTEPPDDPSLHTGYTDDPGSTAVPTSQVLIRAVRGESEKVSVAEIVDALDARSFGLAVLLFSLPSVVPMPPGVPTVVGIILLIVSVQMVFGREDLWLPGILAKRTFPRKSLVAAFEGLAPKLAWLERLMKPRLLFMTGKAGTIVIGVIVLIMAIVLILPLPPGGNFPPALACTVLAMGLIQRDGIVVLLGIVGSVLALAAASYVTVLFIRSAPDLWNWLGTTLGFAQ
jgi:hypothetical protein